MDRQLRSKFLQCEQMLTYRPTLEEAELLHHIGRLLSLIRRFKGYDVLGFAELIDEERVVLAILESGKGDPCKALAVLEKACLILSDDIKVK
jgi:hypothetical protein